jgi:hypothetical protein
MVLSPVKVGYMFMRIRTIQGGHPEGAFLSAEGNRNSSQSSALSSYRRSVCSKRGAGQEGDGAAGLLTAEFFMTDLPSLPGSVQGTQRALPPSPPAGVTRTAGSVLPPQGVAGQRIGRYIPAMRWTDRSCWPIRGEPSPPGTLPSVRIQNRHTRAVLRKPSPEPAQRTPRMRTMPCAGRLRPAPYGSGPTFPARHVPAQGRPWRG